jgi:hypothetical protein
MLCIMADMGVLPGNFFPQTAGATFYSELGSRQYAAATGPALC